MLPQTPSVSAPSVFAPSEVALYRSVAVLLQCPGELVVALFVVVTMELVVHAAMFWMIAVVAILDRAKRKVVETIGVQLATALREQLLPLASAGGLLD